MKTQRILLFLLILQLHGFGQKDSIYYKKIADPATTFISLKEGYKVFTQKLGTGNIKLLLLHGGPFNTHEGFEIFAKQLPLHQYSLIYYDQLGSYYSDQPNDTTLWNIPRVVDEVEQVRQFYKLDSFYLLGHSWGGLLAIEYALKYPDKLKGLILSNKSYSQQSLINTRRALTIQIAEALKCSPTTIEQIKAGQKIEDTLEAAKIAGEFGKRHMVRLERLDDASERGIRHLRMNPPHIKQSYFHDRDRWNALDRLHLIKQPTLIIGGNYDFVKIEELQEMKKRIPNSQLYVCPNGGHFSFIDDAENYFNALKNFIAKTEKR